MALAPPSAESTGGELSWQAPAVLCAVSASRGSSGVLLAWLSCPVPPTTKAAHHRRGGGWGGVGVCWWGGSCFPPCLFPCGRGQPGQPWQQEKGRLAGSDSKIGLWVPDALKPTPHPLSLGTMGTPADTQGQAHSCPRPKEGSSMLGGGEHQGRPLPLKAGWRGSPSTAFFSIHIAEGGGRGRGSHLDRSSQPRKGSHRCRKEEIPPAQHHWAAAPPVGHNVGGGEPWGDLPGPPLPSAVCWHCLLCHAAWRGQLLLGNRFPLPFKGTSAEKAPPRPLSVKRAIWYTSSLPPHLPGTEGGERVLQPATHHHLPNRAPPLLSHPKPPDGGGAEPLSWGQRSPGQSRGRLALLAPHAPWGQRTHL